MVQNPIYEGPLYEVVEQPLRSLPLNIPVTDPRYLEINPVQLSMGDNNDESVNAHVPEERGNHTGNHRAPQSGQNVEDNYTVMMSPAVANALVNEC